jgi:hypothetical protein
MNRAPEQESRARIPVISAGKVDLSWSPWGEFTKIAPRRCVAIAEPVRAAKSCSDFPLCCVGAGQDFTGPIFSINQSMRKIHQHSIPAFYR